MLFVGWKKHVLSVVEGRSVSTDEQWLVVDTRQRFIHPTQRSTINCDIAKIINKSSAYFGSMLLRKNTQFAKEFVCATSNTANGRAAVNAGCAS